MALRALLIEDVSIVHGGWHYFFALLRLVENTGLLLMTTLFGPRKAMMSHITRR